MADTIRLDYITKIEGHADLSIKVDAGKVKRVNLKIFEGARFFEGLVTGMEAKRVPLVTSRICGVCSQSHLIAASTAIENALGVKVSEQTWTLRKLLLNASIIQSHVLHLFFMSLPDYLKLDDAVQLAEKKKDLVKLALKVKMLANRVLVAIGGREIHSVTTALGGFRKLPSQEEIDSLRKELESDLEGISAAFIKTFAGLEKPEYSTGSEFLALTDDDYAPLNGVLETLSEKKFMIDDYRKYLTERVKKYSTAKFVKMKKRAVMTGALARMNVNREKLNPKAKELLEKMGLELPSKSPFNNNLCQAIEIIHLYEECVKLLSGLKIMDEERPRPDYERLETEGKELSGISAVEVPRGVLFHEYRISPKGVVKECNIITPTTQNIQSIENDIKEFLPSVLRQDRKEVTRFIERLIRSYDPCISCSTHFLRIRWG